MDCDSLADEISSASNTLSQYENMVAAAEAQLQQDQNAEAAAQTQLANEQAQLLSLENLETTITGYLAKIPQLEQGITNEENALTAAMQVLENYLDSHPNSPNFGTLAGDFLDMQSQQDDLQSEYASLQQQGQTLSAQLAEVQNDQFNLYQSIAGTQALIGQLGVQTASASQAAASAEADVATVQVTLQGLLSEYASDCVTQTQTRTQTQTQTGTQGTQGTQGTKGTQGTQGIPWTQATQQGPATATGSGGPVGTGGTSPATIGGTGNEDDEGDAGFGADAFLARLPKRASREFLERVMSEQNARRARLVTTINQFVVRFKEVSVYLRSRRQLIERVTAEEKALSRRLKMIPSEACQLPVITREAPSSWAADLAAAVHNH